MWLAPPMVLLKSRIHPLLSYRWPLPLFRGVHSRPQFNGSATIKFDGEGNQVAVTKFEKVLVKNVCIPFMTSLMQGWQQLSDRGCMGDEVCIWRNAETMSLSLFHNQSSHSLGWWHHCLSATHVGSLFVTSTGSASASMSLTSVSPITGRGVSPSLHTRPDGQSNDWLPSLRHIRYLFFSHEWSGSTSIE